MNANQTSHVAAPLGKQTVRGVIISTKTASNDFGTTYRMTVNVTTAAGIYLVNTTIPAGIFDECEKKLECLAGGWIVVLRGCEVQFNATLERSDSDHFAFAKRPTKATIVSFPAEKARTTPRWGEDAENETPAEDPFAQFDAVTA